MNFVSCFCDSIDNWMTFNVDEIIAFSPSESEHGLNTIITTTGGRFIVSGNVCSELKTFITTNGKHAVLKGAKV